MTFAALHCMALHCIALVFLTMQILEKVKVPVDLSYYYERQVLLSLCLCSVESPVLKSVVVRSYVFWGWEDSEVRAWGFPHKA